MHRYYTTLWLFLVTLITLFLDQISKLWILAELSEKNIIKFLPFLNFVLVRNYGVSFGTFNNPMQEQWIFILVSSAIIFALLYWHYKNPSKYFYIPIGMIIGGALGNLIDRIIHGAVIDFIDVIIMHWHYPTFNIADAFICIGVFLLLIWPENKLTRE